MARWIRRLRVVSCLAEMTQQVHSLRASGVRSSQAARVISSEVSATRKSVGVLCRGPGSLVLLWFIAPSLEHALVNSLGCLPSVRQQLLEPTRRLGWQALQDVLEVAMRIMSVELRGLDQAHDGGGALTCTQGTGEEPVGSSESNRPDSVLDMVVVCALSKVHESSGCDTHPVTLAPAGSTWSGPGGDEWPEALQENPSVRREAQRAGRNESEHRAGSEMIHAEADSP